MESDDCQLVGGMEEFFLFFAGGTGTDYQRVGKFALEVDRNSTETQPKLNRNLTETLL